MFMLNSFCLESTNKQTKYVKAVALMSFWTLKSKSVPNFAVAFAFAASTLKGTRRSKTLMSQPGCSRRREQLRMMRKGMTSFRLLGVQLYIKMSGARTLASW
jgi:hypothetical protein